MFLADLGRGTIAVAVLGPAAVSCSSGNGGSSAGSSTDSGATTGATSLAPPTTPSPTSSSSAISAAATSAPTSAAATDALAPVTYHRVSLGFVSAYLLVRGNEAAVVDTGVDGSVDEIQAALDAASVGWDAVGHVILTHHHPDHVGGLSAVLDAATGATAYAGEPDIAQITSPRPLRAVGDGDEVFGLQVIATPGHTPGHIAVLDPASALLVAGDALNRDGGSGVAGANPNFSDDMTQAAETVRKLAGLTIDAILFGHGDPIDSGAGPLLDQLAAS